MRICRLLTYLLVSLITVSTLTGQIGLNITSCIDNTIYEESNTLSNGIGDYIVVGKAGPIHGNHIRRGLIMTDFDLIPSSATIVSAKLVIIGASGSPQNVKLHRVLTQWGEGLSDAPGDELGGALATPNDATWNQSKFSSIFWTNLGGDYVSAPSSSTIVKANVSNTFSGPQFVADIQGWVDGTLDNNGWIMIGNESQSGSAVTLNSGDISSGIPYINVRYTLPARQVLINEVNPMDQWVELYNPGATAIDIGDWYLCNNANCDQVSSADINFLQGSSVIAPGRYVRISWNDIAPVSGEIALMKSASTSFSEVMEDYVQYGAPAQWRSNAAVNAGLWNDRLSYVDAPAASMTIGLDGNVYTNGEDSNQYAWDQQMPTPGNQNVCNSYLNLSSPINLGSYSAVLIDYNGVSQTGSSVGLYFGDFVEFKPNSVVSNGTILQAINRDCSN